MVSLARLVADSGSDLLPVGRLPVPSPEVSGVHISELADPVPYLDGGELLLTTGLPFTLRGVAYDAYVVRLAGAGVSGLVLGLGEGIDDVPDGLSAACAHARLALLVVPDGVPFQRLTRTYWRQAAGQDRASLTRSMSAQTRLIRVLVEPDPGERTVRILAQALGGWAAYVPYDDAGRAVVWPPSRAPLLPQVRREVRRLFAGSRLGAATFPVHQHDVVAYPVGVADTQPGALAVGAGRTLAAADRLLVTTAQAVLTSVHAGVTRPDPGSGPDDQAFDDVRIDLVARRLRGRDDGRPRPAVTTASVRVPDVAGVALRLAREVIRGVRPGQSEVTGWVAALEHARPPLAETVREYLRARGGWEEASRALGVHRNTVRARIAAAEQLIGVGLRDPDIAAQLWLALRDR